MSAALTLVRADDGQLIDIADLCSLLSIGRSTAERWLASGRLLQPIRLSRTCHRWRRVEVLDWIAAGCPHASEWEGTTR